MRDRSSVRSFVRAVVRHVFARVLQQRISNPVAIVDERRKALEVLLVRPAPSACSGHCAQPRLLSTRSPALADTEPTHESTSTIEYRLSSWCLRLPELVTPQGVCLLCRRCRLAVNEVNGLEVLLATIQVRC